jgi:hypothetical protein
VLSSKRLSSMQEAAALLNCRRLPARLNSSEVALLLGFQEHDVAPLVGARLLVVLGKPAANAPKYFAAVDVLARADDVEWLSQATRALARFWQGKNLRKRSASSSRPLVESEA